MSAVTLREGVEEALVAGVEEITEIRVVENETTTTFIPVEALGRKPPGDAGWVPGPRVEDVPADALTRFDIGDESFVLTNLGNKIAVFRNECVHQGMTLDGGLLADGVLTCPWHGFTFDASTGECISAPGAQLQQVPARVDDGTLWIRSGHG